MMLEAIRFTTTDPGKLATELDRFVRDVRQEVERIEAGALGRFKPRRITHGSPAGLVTVAPLLGELVPVSPALGDVDVLLPNPAAADAGRCLLVTRRHLSNVVTLRSGVNSINGESTPSVALPTVLAGYLVFWDGGRWVTVNDA